MKLIKFNNLREPGMPNCYKKANYLYPSLPDLPPPQSNYSGNFIKCKYIKKKKKNQ